MYAVRVFGIFFMLMVVSVHPGLSLYSDIWKVIKFTYDVSSKIAEGAAVYGSITDDSGQKLDDIYSAVKDTMKNQELLADRLEARVQTMMTDMKKRLKNDIEFGRSRDKLTQDYIGRINNIHKSFRDAVDRSYNNITMCDLAIKTTSYGPNELYDSLGKTAQLISPQGISSYFSNFIEILLAYAQREGFERCGKGVSVQQEIYQLYELLVTTEIKAFTVLTFAYTLKSRCLKANFTNEIKGAQTDMVERIVTYMGIIKNSMANVSTEIHRCEPSEYIRNENFVELERYTSMVLLPENQTTLYKGCDGQCSWFQKKTAPLLGFEITTGIGILARNCFNCVSASRVSVCTARSNDEPRRYYGIISGLERYASNSLFGTFDECNSKEGHPYIKKYSSRLDSLTTSCDICACKCLNHETSEEWRHSISLEPQETDISKNMVVTGIRLIKVNHFGTGQVIYPQIKMGKILPDGEVSDEVWKEVGPTGFHRVPKVNYGLDYVTFGEEPDQARYVNLDDEYTFPGYVVTGVKFILQTDYYRYQRPWYWTFNDTGKSVGIIAKMNAYNITTGQLGDSRTYTHPDYSVDIKHIRDNVFKFPGRVERDLEDLDVPTKAKNIKPLSKTRQYIRFTMSDKVKDFGQSTVPFIDIQPVETSPPSPLNGVGLFYKSESNFGGFLALRVMTLNMTNYINTDIPDPDKLKLHLSTI